jgi:hypothetical protein
MGGDGSRKSSPYKAADGIGGHYEDRRYHRRLYTVEAALAASPPFA